MHMQKRECINLILLSYMLLECHTIWISWVQPCRCIITMTHAQKGIRVIRVQYEWTNAAMLPTKSALQREREGWCMYIWFSSDLKFKRCLFWLPLITNWSIFKQTRPSYSAFFCSKFKRTEKDPQIQFLHFGIKTYMHQGSIELLRERLNIAACITVNNYLR